MVQSCALTPEAAQFTGCRCPRRYTQLFIPRYLLYGIVLYRIVIVWYSIRIVTRDLSLVGK